MMWEEILANMPEDKEKRKSNLDAIKELAKQAEDNACVNQIYAIACSRCGSTYPINPFNHDTDNMAAEWQCNICDNVFKPIDSLHFHEGQIIVDVKKI